MNILACMLSYKMADLTDKTVDALIHHGFNIGEDLFVFENQAYDGNKDLAESDGQQSMEGVSHYVNYFTGSNLRMTGGFNFICDHVASWPERSQPDVLWLCTNDFEITYLQEDKTIQNVIEAAFNTPSAIGWWHPALEDIPNYAYPWMMKRNMPSTGAFVKTWMTDFICPAIDWNLLKNIRERHGHWFNPKFYRGWGIDYETCYRARQRGLSVVVSNQMTIKHEASKTYISGAAPENKDEFYDKALHEMWSVMEETYGKGWFQKMRGA